jgi:hypothetical protein
MLATMGTSIRKRTDRLKNLGTLHTLFLELSAKSIRKFRQPTTDWMTPCSSSTPGLAGLYFVIQLDGPSNKLEAAVEEEKKEKN